MTAGREPGRNEPSAEAVICASEQDGTSPFALASLLPFNPLFVAAYLTSGTPVLHTTARTQDVLNPDAGQVVPGSFRTDGEWIWTDTVAYYLEQHGMAPEEELSAHIGARRQAGDVDAETDYDTAVEAANFLLYPPPEYDRKAAWTPGANGKPPASSQSGWLTCPEASGQPIQ
jgi:hypothetical protein